MTNEEMLLELVGLMADHDLQFYFYRDRETGQVCASANCSDTFEWGTADAETITPDDIPDLKEAIALARTLGDELWCARKRGMRPQGAWFNVMQKHLSNEALQAFLDAGPERPTGLFNPHSINA